MHEEGSKNFYSGDVPIAQRKDHQFQVGKGSLNPENSKDLGSECWNTGKGEKDKQEVKKKIDIRGGILKMTTAGPDCVCTLGQAPH